MITKQECADYINANMSVALTPEEVETLRKSIHNNKAGKFLAEILIEVFGDVTMLVEIRDAE
tara:strand:- start:118 stop:303 length:186 start_codon:yes stop_codon:yes gene_type:complete